MRVDEPRPGQLLTETNLDTGAVTEFTVYPGAEEQTTITRISSDWKPKGGPSGLIDRTMTPVLMRWIFGKQLRELERYLRSGPDPA